MGLTTMKLSTDRILTTHTGSLPRATDLTTILEALDSGRIPDPEAFDARVRRAVGEIVRQQLEATKDAWQKAAAPPEGKASLAVGCKAATDQAKTAMAAYGCSW